MLLPQSRQWPRPSPKPNARAASCRSASQCRQDRRNRNRCKNYDNVAAIIAPQKLERVGVQIEEEIVGVQTHVHRGLLLERDEKHDRDE